MTLGLKHGGVEGPTNPYSGLRRLLKDSARPWPDLICLYNCLIHGK